VDPSLYDHEPPYAAHILYYNRRSDASISGPRATGLPLCPDKCITIAMLVQHLFSMSTAIQMIPHYAFNREHLGEHALQAMQHIHMRGIDSILAESTVGPTNLGRSYTITSALLTHSRSHHKTRDPAHELYKTCNLGTVMSDHLCTHDFCNAAWSEPRSVR